MGQKHFQFPTFVANLFCEGIRVDRLQRHFLVLDGGQERFFVARIAVTLDTEAEVKRIRQLKSSFFYFNPYSHPNGFYWA